MKIYIVTVHKSRNAGSFLQSKALGDYLANYGDVFYLDPKVRNTKKFMFEAVSRALLRGKLRRALYEWNRSKSFLKRQKEFNEVSLTEIEDNKNNFCVLGSDEIWNISRSAFSKYPVFWGAGLDKCTLISYAPSLNNASEDMLREYHADDYLSRFDAISVRDEYSAKVVSQFTDKKVNIVIDPTFFFDRNYYLTEYRGMRVPYKKYIATYCIENKFTNETESVEAIKKLAKSVGEPLVSVGMYNEWCDYCASPEDVNPFVLYNDADYVITNTFHGTAFAIIFQKQFIVVVRKENQKVISLLEEFGLEGRIVDESDLDEMRCILEQRINYTEVEQKIEQKRLLAKCYLDAALKRNQ